MLPLVISDIVCFNLGHLAIALITFLNTAQPTSVEVP